jgi:hypothetical protein
MKYSPFLVPLISNFSPIPPMIPVQLRPGIIMRGVATSCPNFTSLTGIINSKGEILFIGLNKIHSLVASSVGPESILTNGALNMK